MQKLYNYTRYFQPSKTYTDEFLPRFIDGLISLDRELKNNPLGESKFSFKEFRLPFHQDISGYHYQILTHFAKYMKVKMMWRSFVVFGQGIQRGIMIIGEEDRIELLHYILIHYFTAEAGYLSFIKETKGAEAKESPWGNIRVYSSKLIDALHKTTVLQLEKLLVLDIKYDNRLENYILEQFDLNGKLYKTQKKIYYHTITTKFVHKRMLL